MAMELQQNIRDCIDACNDCRDECQQVLFRYCLEQGGKHVARDHVVLMADCIEICQAASGFMLRGSDMHNAVCNLCAEICESCAESCDAVGGDEMAHCAETCRDCADICRDMAGGGGGRGRAAREAGGEESHAW